MPTVGSILWVDSTELRCTYDKIQRLFTCGRRLEDVVTDLHRGRLLPSDLRKIDLVHWESKWYSHNKRLVHVLSGLRNSLKRMLHWCVDTSKSSKICACFFFLREDRSAIINPCLCVSVVIGRTVHLVQVQIKFEKCLIFSNSRIGNSLRKRRRYVPSSSRVFLHHFR